MATIKSEWISYQGLLINKYFSRRKFGEETVDPKKQLQLRK